MLGLMHGKITESSLRHYPSTCLDKLRKTTKITLRIFSLLAKMKIIYTEDMNHNANCAVKSGAVQWNH
jgi:hypothetical protein